jgi:hypothetical protein
MSSASLTDAVRSRFDDTRDIRPARLASAVEKDAAVGVGLEPRGRMTLPAAQEGAVEADGLVALRVEDDGHDVSEVVDAWECTDGPGRAEGWL